MRSERQPHREIRSVLRPARLPLRKTEVVSPKDNRRRLLDSVNIITGVSGGSFTALAYGL